jgi:hypothetical protein
MQLGNKVRVENVVDIEVATPEVTAFDATTVVAEEKVKVAAE